MMPGVKTADTNAGKSFTLQCIATPEEGPLEWVSTADNFPMFLMVRKISSGVDVA